MICQLINETVVSVRESSNVQVFLPRFAKKYQMQIRTFDVYKKLIFEYGPPSINDHNRSFYVLNDGDHIYSLDDNLHTLNRKDAYRWRYRGGNMPNKYSEDQHFFHIVSIH